jgi:hypothetical protein
MDEIASPWRKSTHSAQGGSSCVEVAATGDVLIRDTTDRGGVTLSVPAAAWASFLSIIK